MQTVSSPLPLTLNDVSTVTVCEDGSESVNLDRDIFFTINDNENLINGNANSIGNITWYKADPTLLPALLRSTLLVQPKVFVPIIPQDYYFIYKRPSDDCELVGKTTISLSNAVCCAADAGNIIRPIGGKETITTGNQSICLGD